VSWYQKDKTRKANQSGFTGARNSEWQWHQLGHMQICTSPHTDNHASIPPLSFLQAGCPSCHPANSVKALKVAWTNYHHHHHHHRIFVVRRLHENQNSGALHV